jgi:hypothetical protein
MIVLKEILADEAKIGGMIIETSEAFPIGYTSPNDTVNIRIDEMSDGWTCTHKINQQV